MNRRFTAQEMAKGFSLFEKAQAPNTEWYMKVVAAVQNEIQCYYVIYDEKKRATTQTSLDHFLKKIELNPTRNQNVCHQI